METESFRDLNTTRLRINLTQLITSLETDEDGDSERAKGKRLSRTCRMPSSSRNKRLRTRTS
jgi:hypothetical protein